MAGNNQVSIGIQLNFEGFDRKSLEREIERVEDHLQGMGDMKLDAEIDISEESLGRFSEITERLEDVVDQLNNVTRKLRTEDIKITVEGQAVKKIKNNVENAFQEGLSQANVSGDDDDKSVEDRRRQREDRAGGAIEELDRNMDLLRRSIERMRHSMSSLPSGNSQVPRGGQLQQQGVGQSTRKAVLKQFSGTRREGAKEQLKQLKEMQQFARKARQELTFLIDTTNEGTEEAQRLKKKLQSLDEIQMELSDERQALERIVDSSKTLEKIVQRTERSQQEVESLIKKSANQVKKSLNDIKSSDIDSFLEPFSQLSRQLGQDLRVVQRQLEKVQNDGERVSKKLQELRNRPDVDNESNKMVQRLEKEQVQLKEVENALESQKDELRSWKNQTGQAVDKLKSMQAVLRRNDKFVEEAQKSAQDAKISYRELEATFDRLAKSEAMQGNKLFNQREIQRAEAGIQKIEKTIDNLRSKLSKIDVARQMEIDQLKQMRDATRTVDGEERKGAGPFAEEGFGSERERRKQAEQAIQAANQKYNQLADDLEGRLSAAYDKYNGKVAENIKEMKRQSERVLEVKENVKDLVDDVGALKKNYNSLNSSTNKTTQDIINQASRLEDAKNEYQNLVKKIQKYEAQLESAAAAGDKQSEEVEKVRKELQRAKKELSGKALSTENLVESGKVQAQAKALKEVRENAMDTAQEVGRLDRRLEQAQEQFEKSGGQSEEAARKLQNLQGEYEGVRKDLSRYVNVLERAEENGEELSQAEQRLLRISRELERKTRKQTKELRDNAEAYERVQNAANGVSGAFGSYTDNLADSIKKNFQFISAIGVVASALFGLQMAFEEILEESRALTRAMTVMRSKSMSFVQIQKRVRKEVRATAVEFGERVDEVSEVVFQLGSAGLSAEASMSALDHTMQLIIGTEAEAQEATKAVAGAFNVFGEQMDDLSSKSQKFQRITDTMIKVFREHQVEMNEVIQGLEFSSAAASAAGFSFQETAGFLAVLNDKMIKGGKAGRGLQNVMSKIARNTDTLKNVFGVEIDDNSPLSEQFVGILEQFKEKIGEGALSVQELREQFKLAGLRGGRSFSILVQNVGEVKETLSELEEGAAGAGDRVRDIVEGSLIQSFEQAKQALFEIVRQGLDPVITTLQFAADAFKQLEEGLSLMGPLRDFVVIFSIIGGTGAIAIQTLTAVAKLFGGMAQILIAQTIPAVISFIKNFSFSGLINTTKQFFQALFTTGEAAQLARIEIFGALGAAKAWAVTIGGLVAAIPVLVAAIGWWNKSMDELKRSMEQASNEVDRLTSKGQELESFSKRLGEINQLSGNASDEVIGDKIRKELKKLSKDTINTNDLLAKSNHELGNSIDVVTKKLRKRVEERKRLLKLQKQEERKKFIDDLRGRAQNLGKDIENKFSQVGRRMRDVQRLKNKIEEAEASGSSSVITESDKAAAGGFGGPAGTSLEDAKQRLKSLKEEATLTDENFTNVVRRFKQLKGEASDMDAPFKDNKALEEFKRLVKSVLSEEQYRKFQNIAKDAINEGVKVPSIQAKNEVEQLIGTYQTLVENMEVASSPVVIDKMIEGFDGADKRLERLDSKIEDVTQKEGFEGAEFLTLGSVQPSAFKDKMSSVFDNAAQNMDVTFGQTIFQRAFLPKNLESVTEKTRKRIANNLFGLLKNEGKGKFSEISDQMAEVLIKNFDDIEERGQIFDKFEGDGVRMLKAIARHMDSVTGKAAKWEALMGEIFQGTKSTLEALQSAWDQMWGSAGNLKKNAIISKEQTDRVKDYIDDLGAASRQLSTLNEETQKQAERQKKVNKARLQRKRLKEEFGGGGGVQTILSEGQRRINAARADTGRSEKERNKAIKDAIKWVEKRLKIQREAEKATSKQQLRWQKMRQEIQKSTQSLDDAVHHYQDINKLISDQVNMKAKSLDHTIDNLRKSEKLTGDFYERQKAMNTLINKQKEMVELRREAISTFKEETALRYELISSGQKALNLESETAGMAAKAMGMVTRISSLKAKERKISQQINKSEGTNLQMERELRSVQQAIVEKSEKLFQMKEKLKNKEEEINQEVLDKRLELMQEILDSMKRQSEEATKQVSKGLERALNTNPLDKFRKAGKLAQLTGRSIGATLADTKSAMDNLVKGLKDGRVSVEQFMSVVGDKRFKDWAERVQGVNEDIDKMNAKMRRLRKKELKSSIDNFEKFIQAGNLKQARKEFERVSTLSSDLFKGSNPELFQASRRRLIEMRKEMGRIAKTKTQKRLEQLKKMSGFIRTMRKEVQKIVKERQNELASLREMESLIKGGKLGDGLAVKVRSVGAQKAFKEQVKKIDESVLQITKLIKENQNFIRKEMGGAASKILQASRNILETSGVKVEPTKKKEGGYIPGFGGGDKIPAKLEKGEFVMPKEAVSKFGVPFFEMLRRGQVPKFADGGQAGSESSFASRAMKAPKESKNKPEDAIKSLVAKLNKQMDSIEQLFKDFVNDNALVNFFLNEFPEKYEEGVNEIVGMLSGALEKAISNTTEMIDSFADAWDSLDESLEDISEQFEKSVEDAQTGLRRNKSSYFQYLDSVHQAEEERIQARLKAEKKYREALKDIEQEFAKNVIGVANEIVSKMSEGVSKIPGLITKGLGAGINQLTKTFQDEITTGVSELFEETLSVNQGAISKSVGVDKATVGAVGVGAGKAVGAGITAAVKSLETTFKTLTNALLGALSKLFKATVKDDQELINRMDQFINDLPSRLSDLSDRLSGNIKQLANTFISKLPEIGTQFISGLSTVLSSIGDVLLGDQLQNAVNELLEKLPTLLSQELLPALTRALRGLVKLLPKVSEFVEQFFAQLAKFFNSDNFKRLAQDIGSVVVEVIGDIITSLSDILDGLLNAAFEVAKNLLESLLANLPKMLMGVIESIIVVIKNIGDYLKPLFDSLVRGLVKAVGNLIKQLPSLLFNVMVKLPALIAEALLRTFGLKHLANAIEKLVETLTVGNEERKERRETVRSAQFKKLNPNQKLSEKENREARKAWKEASRKNVVTFEEMGDWFDKTFHSGGLITSRSDLTLSSDEVPIIAQTGEGVLSRKGMQALGGVEALRQLNQGVNPYVDQGELRKFGADKRFRKRRQESVPKQTSGANQIRSRSNISNNVENDNSTNITIEEINIASDNPEDAEQAADELVKEVDRKMAKRQQNNKSEFGKEIEGGK